MASLEEFRKELKERGCQPPTHRELKYTNETPEAKASDVKVVRRNNDRWKTVLAWGFIILALSVACFVYLVSEDKVNVAQFVCPDVNLNEGDIVCDCAPCPACPDCSVSNVCPKFPDTINVNCAE